MDHQNLAALITLRCLQFTNELLENDRTEFTFAEAAQIADEIGLTVPAPVITMLREEGLTMVARQPPRNVRGFQSNNHDRFSACPMHGGAVYDGMMMSKYGVNPMDPENRPRKVDTGAARYQPCKADGGAARLVAR